MISELVFYWVREICHHTENVLENEGFHQVLGLFPRYGLALSVLLFLAVKIAFDIVKRSESPDSLIELYQLASMDCQGTVASSEQDLRVLSRRHRDLPPV